MANAAADFIDVDIPTSQQQLADDAVSRLQTLLVAQGINGWTASEGSLLTILISVLSAMAADNATVASQVPAAILRTMGTSLFVVPYVGQTYATVVSTWALADTVGHTIPAGTYVTISDVGFYVQSDVVVAPGASTANVMLTAVDPGPDANGLSGTVEQVNEIDWVQSVVTIGSTSGGQDAEDDAAYINRLVKVLALQAPRPITADNFAAMVMSDLASDVLPAGVVVGRATALDGWDSSLTATFTANTTNASPNLASVSSFANLAVGVTVTGTGVPASTYLTTLTPGSSAATLSKNATATNTGTTLTVQGTYGNERTVTVFVTDSGGNALSSPDMAALASWLEGFREVNFVVNVEAPTYTTVYVTTAVHVLPGYDSASVVASVGAAVTAYLSPQSWGSTASSGSVTANWLNAADGFNIIRYRKLLGLIEAVPGVDYALNGSTGLAIGFSASPSGTSDLTLPGQAPLPLSDTTTPTVIVTAV